MFKFITHRPLWVNVIAAIAIVAAFIFGLLAMLSSLTRHGQYEKVPVVLGKSLTEAMQILTDKGFAVEVQDSVWEDGKAPHSVIRQSPEGDEMVKAKRRIYLTVNRFEPPTVELPNMVGLSFRNAELYLRQMGLKLGDTSRKPDIAKDAVLEQLYHGQPFKPGYKVYVGSTIDFVLGSGIGTEQIDVPNLVGLTYAQAKMTIESLGLTVAGVVTEPGVEDTDNALVYKQRPLQAEALPDGSIQKNKIRAGQSIDLWLDKTLHAEAVNTPKPPDASREEN